MQYIKEKGIYAFHKKYGYGVRANVAAPFSRLKRCLGESLKTRRTPSRENEEILLAHLLNLWNSFGRAEYIKTA
ncbi:hypothetical protein [Chromobacterium amazonense]|uniref:hypothetical protein n=1 Tax=Chromobacterium amazonense TaxID=1382803 RepID=UPI003F7B0C1B